jgi:nucleoside-diphosphate-sugar epimerase
VLVTGASGFVGGHLLAVLAAAGIEVVAVPGRAPVATIPGVRVRPGREMGAGTRWHDALEGVDRVVHLAGLAHGRDGGDRMRLRAVNVAGTLALARAARAAGVRRFLFLSSIGVHGNASRGGPISEASALRPEAPYAESKVEAEAGLRDLFADAPERLVIVRPPLVHGPGAPGNPARLLRLAASGLPLPLASVANRRSFVAVANLCAALRCCIEDPRAAGETFVVADDAVVSTPQLLRELACRCGRPARLLPCPPALLRAGGALLGRSGDVERLLADLEVDAGRIRTVLDFVPPLPFAAGLDAWAGS